jgi:hypothetical protein
VLVLRAQRIQGIEGQNAFSYCIDSWTMTLSLILIQSRFPRPKARNETGLGPCSSFVALQWFAGRSHELQTAAVPRFASSFPHSCRQRLRAWTCVLWSGSEPGPAGKGRGHVVCVRSPDLPPADGGVRGYPGPCPAALIGGASRPSATYRQGTVRVRATLRLRTKVAAATGSSGAANALSLPEGRRAAGTFGTRSFRFSRIKPSSHNERTKGLKN